MAKPVSFGDACNIPKGTFEVGGRHFKNRLLSMGEYRAISALSSDLIIVAAGLSILRNEGEEVTPEWLEGKMPASPVQPGLYNDLSGLYYYLVGGASALSAYIASLKPSA